VLHSERAGRSPVSVVALLVFSPTQHRPSPIMGDEDDFLNNLLFQVRSV
jgi:hypothetical protein